MVFEVFLGKKIKILQKDGYMKYGVLLAIDNNQFLKIEFLDGRIEFINVEIVLSVSLNEGRP